jgi:hypothetical protein
MKNFLIIIVASISLVACQSSDSKSKLTDEQKKNALADSSNYTSVQWLDSTYRDFGKVKEGEVLEVAFHFKNTGEHNLIVSDVRPGCGCTDPQKPEEPIAPGKEGVIKAKFNSKGQHIGENRKYITVTANTKPSPLTELTFRAEVTN